MDISKEILFEKFLKPKLNNIAQLTQNQSYKKSGTFTGLRNSLTYTKNTNKRYAQKASDYLYLNKTTVNNINETIEFLENNQNNFIKYRKNIKTLWGTKRSAVPHGIIQQIINRETPPKPRDGRVPTMLNTKWGQQEIQKKYRNIARLFKNLRGG